MTERLSLRARSLDDADSLAPWRERFIVPDGVIYLDGNSLGCLPRATPQRMEQVIRGEWGAGLIRSWNSADWVDLPARLGAKIAPLIGAQPHEVIACDSTSVNLFKLIAAALDISEETVKIHRGRVMQKLGIVSVAELVRLCEKAGVEPAEVREPGTE